MKTLHFALAGNPNVGKSTLFNYLTGLRQHTGNWPGKTVEVAQGLFTFRDQKIILTDLPGTYSLCAHSPEEEAAKQFLQTGYIDGVIVVCDGSLLSRHLILVLQLLALKLPILLCVNLIDEAEKRGIQIDYAKLSRCLGIPVLPCTARGGKGVETLCEAMLTLPSMEHADVDYSAYGGDIPAQAQKIAESVISHTDNKKIKRYIALERRLDRLFTGPLTAYPTMALLVLFVFWLTISGASYLSAGLEIVFSRFNGWVDGILAGWVLRGFPVWLHTLLVDGILLTVTQVVAVMLPPMAVFFPLFTLLEDMGYLPRVAFSLDRLFRGCGACGKQALTMLMGLGCNAAGVTGCRIIDAPRERKMAILTNVLMPCNGRLPMVLFLTGMLTGIIFSPGKKSAVGLRAVLIFLVLLMCTGMTLFLCRFLHKTMLRGEVSAFTLELPSYRLPQVGQVVLRSVLDRTLLILGRAVAVAAPAGVVLWLLHQISWQDKSLFVWLMMLLDPVGQFFGMDGVILAGFLLSLPASELFLPLVLSGYSMLSPVVSADTEALLIANGWNGVTVLCVLCFTLFHWPCATTIWTIYKETGSLKWTLVGVLMPTLTGLCFCALLHWGSVLLF